MVDHGQRQFEADYVAAHQPADRKRHCDAPVEVSRRAGVSDRGFAIQIDSYEAFYAVRSELNRRFQRYQTLYRRYDARCMLELREALDAWFPQYFTRWWRETYPLKICTEGVFDLSAKPTAE
ncbi:hypothetical protein ACQPW1_10330 [Nocardia sp. CA-128927]|uniref:hypothetical protein n=1 Tax=Nocardia sp. CA-128927 TaxID=3239975 RepID=UPI003D98F190